MPGKLMGSSMDDMANNAAGNAMYDMVNNPAGNSTNDNTASYTPGSSAVRQTTLRII